MIDKPKPTHAASEIFHNIRRGSLLNGAYLLTDRNISGNTLLANSPLHEDQPKGKSYIVCLFNWIYYSIIFYP